MNLQEPRKKRKTNLRLQSPFPITLNCDDWVIYTAHLTDLGSCIVDPDEITAVHSMGFFGKGSLSRGYPSFGKVKHNVPPIVRNRQWIRRQKWLKEVKDLSSESPSNQKNINWRQINSEESYNYNADKKDLKMNIEKTEDTQIFAEHDDKKEFGKHKEENTPDIVEINPYTLEKNNKDEVSSVEEVEIDEVILDSTEEDDIYVVNKDTDKSAIIKPNDKKCSVTQKVEEFYNLSTCDFKNAGTFIDNNETNLQGKLLVLPDSDSETEEYLKNINPRIEGEGFPIRETLHLTFVETFFLLFGLGCLQLINFDGSLLDINNAWLYFCKEDKDFVQKYVVYHYFRSKGWVVKPGLKYGGDFLLYKQGPSFYHASYIVIVDVVDADTLIRDPDRSLRKMTWQTLFGLERLSETAAKEILFAQVLWPSSVPRSNCPSTPDILSEFTVRELLWRRWNPKQNRDIIRIEEEDEDSC